MGFSIVSGLLGSTVCGEPHPTVINPIKKAKVSNRNFEVFIEANEGKCSENRSVLAAQVGRLLYLKEERRIEPVGNDLAAILGDALHRVARGV